jgi:nitroreductase
MNALAAIETRRSAVKLGEPGPGRAHLETILRAGARAPDHGRLEPWRFFVFQGDAREILAAAAAAQRSARFPNTTPGVLAQVRSRFFRAPVVIVVAASIAREAMAPETEQLLAAGAATQNMWLAAHALGYGAMWKTGDLAYDPMFKASLGLPAEDHIVAFLHVGAPIGLGPVRDVDTSRVTRWVEALQSNCGADLGIEPPTGGRQGSNDMIDGSRRAIIDE